MPQVSILPLAIRLAAKPGEIVQQDFIIQAFPTGELRASIEGDSNLFRLREFGAFTMIRERLTDEEFAQLPPALRNEEHRFSIRFEQTASVGDGEPLPVEARQHVTGVVQCIAASEGPPSFHKAKLAVTGPGIDRTEVPILFVEGATQIEFLDRPVVAHQSQFTSANLKLTIPGAPETVLTLEASSGFIEIPPQRVTVPEGGSVTTKLALRAAPQTPLGPFQAMLAVKGNSDTIEHLLFDLLVKPPVKPPELDKPLMIDRIHHEYLSQGGRMSELGYPIAEVMFAGNTAQRLYRGGVVKASATVSEEGTTGVVTQALVTNSARVTFVGFRCVHQADHEQLSPADEPYFVITIFSSTGQAPLAQKFGPFEHTKSGTEATVGAFLANGLTPNPFTIMVLAYENDAGDPDKTARNVQLKLVELAQQVQALANSSGADAASGPGLGVASTAGSVAGVLSGPLGALAAIGVVSALNLGDDFVGQGAALVFDRPEELTTPPELGKLQGNRFNVRIPIKGGGEGEYELFFDVNLTAQSTPVTI